MFQTVLIGQVCQNREYVLPKSRMVKFLFFRSSFGDLKENCCPVLGKSWSFALKDCITCKKKRMPQVDNKTIQINFFSFAIYVY